jgi:hypothetical protein
MDFWRHLKKRSTVVKKSSSKGYFNKNTHRLASRTNLALSIWPICFGLVVTVIAPCYILCKKLFLLRLQHIPVLVCILFCQILITIRRKYAVLYKYFLIIIPIQYLSSAWKIVKCVMCGNCMIIEKLLNKWLKYYLIVNHNIIVDRAGQVEPYLLRSFRFKTFFVMLKVAAFLVWNCSSSKSYVF